MTESSRIIEPRRRPARAVDAAAPDLRDVEAVRELLELMTGFANDDQRARYLLSSNWLRDRGAAAASRLNPPRGTVVQRLSEALDVVQAHLDVIGVGLDGLRDLEAVTQ